jgi:hypothetical protein
MTSQRKANILGLIGTTCLLFTLSWILFPKSMKPLLPLLDKIGPFSWLVLLGMIVLPSMAAKQGSKLWWAATAAGAFTFIALLSRIH